MIWAQWTMYKQLKGRLHWKMKFSWMFYFVPLSMLDILIFSGKHITAHRMSNYCIRMLNYCISDVSNNPGVAAGNCRDSFEKNKCSRRFQESKLHLFRDFYFWVKPLFKWFQQSSCNISLWKYWDFNAYSYIIKAYPYKVWQLNYWMPLR